MAKPTTESHLAVLRALRSNLDGAGVSAGLEKLLGHKALHGIVLKSIASMAEQVDARSLAPALTTACEDLLKPEAAKRDPGCEALTAILKTLLAWDIHAPELYLAVSYHVHKTPTFGDPVDSAAEPRGLAAIGLAMTQPAGAILRIMDLLADEQKVTRAHAARALGVWRGLEALPLLRLKALLGDEDAETVAEVFGGLLNQDGRGHLEFVAGFLRDEKEGTVEAAALALGQSKLEGALGPLVRAYPRHAGSGIATTFLMAIALLRTAEAVEFLLTELARARPREGANILDALAVHKHDPKVRTRVREVVERQPGLRAAFEAIFRE